MTTPSMQMILEHDGLRVVRRRLWWATIIARRRDPFVYVGFATAADFHDYKKATGHYLKVL